MQRISEIDLNVLASIQDPSENNSMEDQQQQQQNLDTDMVESGSDATVIVNSNENNRLIQVELLPEENHAVANRERRERVHWSEEEHRCVIFLILLFCFVLNLFSSFNLLVNSVSCSH
jgi:hypothetical protein